MDTRLNTVRRLTERAAAAGLPAPPVDWFRHPRRHVWRDSAYLLTSLPIALASFCCVLIPMLLSFGTLVLWVGIPLAAVTLAVARAFASFERRRLATVAGTAIEAR